ncbi:MAG TPA: hypothetical protein VEL82_05615 [Thermoplasmata archaeon]|nr:hypothetical protein [Thermoplasmata archaeon]
MAAKALVVRTRSRFPVPPSEVWPLLCSSRMDGSTSFLFRLGVPRPIECRLPAGPGGVGRERECVSDRGVVRQRILEWVPERRLSFRMVSSDLALITEVSDLRDTFELATENGGAAVTRTTELVPKRELSSLRRAELFLGVKQVHRYVFRNWKRLARASS